MPAIVLRVPFCGLPCRDVAVDSGAADGARATGGCPVCRAAALDASATTETRPRIGGAPVSPAAALDRAAALLAGARSPLVYGLSRSPSGAAQAAAQVARAVRGAIDVEDTSRLAVELESMATFGLASATFGEIRSRADVALLWRCDPRVDHPGLLAGGAAILRIAPAGPDDDLDALLALRACVAGSTPRTARPGGVPVGELRAAATALRRARLAVILFDPSATEGPRGLAVAATLALLARDLNAEGRAAARSLGAGGNTAGAMAALLSATGFPRAVGFHSGGPRHDPETFSGPAMLEKSAADAVLLVGARHLPGAAARGPALVVVGAALPGGCPEPDVFLPAATGIDGGGLFLRVDGVPVRVRPIERDAAPTTRPAARRPLPRMSGRPREEDVLEALLGRLHVPAEPPPADASTGARR